MLLESSSYSKRARAKFPYDFIFESLTFTPEGQPAF
jgi:hypothetical protein